MVVSETVGYGEIGEPGGARSKRLMDIESAATLAGCTTFVLYMCLLMFILPQAGLAVDGAKLTLSPIALFAGCVFAGFVAIRMLCSRMRSKAWQTVNMAIALVGAFGFTALFALCAHTACIVPMAIGTACACFGWCLYLDRYAHSRIAKLVAVSTIIAMVFVAALVLIDTDARMLAAAAALSVALSVALLWSVSLTSKNDLLEVTAAQSRKRAVTAHVDRWTYTVIGVNLGFAIELARTGCTAMSFLGWPGERVGFVLLVVVPIAVSASLWLPLHKDTDYALERYSKMYLAFCIALFTLPLGLTAAPVQALCIGALVAVAVLQLIIMVNASIEFIRFEQLNPAWYMGEIAFAGAGLFVGAVCAYSAVAQGWGGESLLCACIAITLFNIFVKPRIDEGVFPSAVFFDSLFEDAKYDESIEGTGAQAIDAGSSAASQEESPIRTGREALHGGFAMASEKSGASEAFDNAQSHVAPKAASTIEPAEKPEGSIVEVGSDEIVQSATSLSGRASWRARVAYVCQANSLSPRQTEIFELLAKGRDAKYIQDTFCISKGTTKTHIYNIYRKLDVHSRQDLIDMVDAVTDEQLVSLRE